LPANHLPEFTKVLRPFAGRAFATGIGQSASDIGPLALLPLADGSLLVSGGPARNQLFRFGITGEPGASATGGVAPAATLAEPVYDMALDASGFIWATT